MPTYTYRCPKCGAESEHRLAIADLESAYLYCLACVEQGADPKDVPLERSYTPFAIWGTKVKP